MKKTATEISWVVVEVQYIDGGEWFPVAYFSAELYATAFIAARTGDGADYRLSSLNV